MIAISKHECFRKFGDFFHLIHVHHLLSGQGLYPCSSPLSQRDTENMQCYNRQERRLKKVGLRK
jgi:hypothetical protein